MNHPSSAPIKPGAIVLVEITRGHTLETIFRNYTDKDRHNAMVDDWPVSVPAQKIKKRQKECGNSQETISNRPISPEESAIRRLLSRVTGYAT